MNNKNPRDLLLQRARFEDAPSLFGDDALTDWEREWIGMPEYLMGNTEPAQKISVLFASHEDVLRFAELLGIKVTPRTDTMWFPDEREYLTPTHLRWVDEK